MGFLKDLVQEAKEGFQEGQDDVDKIANKLSGKKPNDEKEQAAESEEAGANILSNDKGFDEEDAAGDESGDETPYIDSSIIPDIKKMGSKLGSFIKKKISS